MAEIKIAVLKPLLITTVLAVQGCATTDELFAEYDDHFCPTPENHANHSPHAAPAIEETVVTIPWEPMVFFRAGSSVLSVEGSELIKANARQLKKMPGYKIALKSMSEDQITDEFNRTLYNKRLQSIKHLLVEVLGIKAVRIIETDLIKEPMLAAANDGMVDVDLVDIDRRIAMHLLDSNLVRVSLETTRRVTGNALTDRSWTRAKAFTAPKVPKATLPAKPIPARLLPAVPKPASARRLTPSPVLVPRVISTPVAAPQIVPTVVTPPRPAAAMPKPAILKPVIPAPVAPKPAMPAPVATTTAIEDEITTETYTAEQKMLADEITSDLKRRRLTRPLGNSAYDKVRRLRELHPMHDYSVNGEKYIARILMLLGRKAVREGNIELASKYLVRAVKIDPNVRRQEQLVKAIANAARLPKPAAPAAALAATATRPAPPAMPTMPAIPKMPAMPELPAPQAPPAPPAILTQAYQNSAVVVTATPNMRTITYEKWTVTEPVAPVAPVPAVPAPVLPEPESPAAALPAAALPEDANPKVSLPVPELPDDEEPKPSSTTMSLPGDRGR